MAIGNSFRHKRILSFPIYSNSKSEVSATATVFTLLQLTGTTAERNASSASAEQSVSYAECSHAQFGLESAGNWAGACEMERAAK